MSLDLTITLDLTPAETAFVLGKYGSESAAIENLALECVEYMEAKIRADLEFAENE